MPPSSAYSITYSQQLHPFDNVGLGDRTSSFHITWQATALFQGREYHINLGSQFRPVSIEEFAQLAQRDSRQFSQHKIKGETAQTQRLHQHFRTTQPRPKAESPADASPKPEPKSSSNTQERVIPKRPDRPKVELSEEVRIIDLCMPSQNEFDRDIRRFRMTRFKDVRQEYRQLIKKYHPDKFGDNQVHMEEWMKIINGVHEMHLRRMERIKPAGAQSA